MASYDDIMVALRKADAAGDTAAATRLAQMAREARAAFGGRDGDDHHAFNPPAAPAASEPPPGMVLNPATGQMVDMQSPNNPYVREGRGRAVMQGLGQGLGFGWMDEAVAGAHALTGPGARGENYDFAKGVMDEELRRARDQHPVAAIGGEVAGALAVPVGAIGSGGTLAARVGKSGLAGAGQGAIYGSGVAEGGADERLDGAKWGGLLGGAIGAAAPAIGAGLSRAANKRAISKALKDAAKNAPSLDDLRATANALYKQADSVTTLPRQELANRMPGLLEDAARSGMDDVLTPGAARVASQLDDMASAPGAHVSFRDLDVMRKRAGIPAGNTTNKTEQAIAMKIIDGLDGYVNDVDPALGGVVGEARKTWGRMSRAQKVEDAMAAGDTYVSGAASGTRNQIASLLRNPKRSAGYSEVEKAALKRIANPGVLENVVHYAGGGLGQTLSGLTGAAVGSAGGAVTSAVGAATGAAGGAIARRLSEAITRRKADEAMRIIASGGAKAANKMAPKTRKLIEELYMAGIRAPTAGLSEAVRK